MSFWFHCFDKITNKIISEFLQWNFLYPPGGFLEAFWVFLCASLFMIFHTKSPGSPKSFHEAPRKLQKNSGQKSRNNSVGIFVQTMKPKGHYEINWPLATYFFVWAERKRSRAKPSWKFFSSSYGPSQLGSDSSLVGTYCGTFAGD